MLYQITPVILTYNEAPNIERTVARLTWAREIIVVDSLSTDDTVELASRTAQVKVFQREFDCHVNQWNFALTETGIASEWVLALDADYVLTSELIAELATLIPSADTAGYRARFVYCIDGRVLRGSAYTPVTVLYRHKGASYRQDGHTQRVVINGTIEELRSKILHDDRKSLSHWVRAQDKYMQMERQKLAETAWRDLGWADRIRKMRVVAPIGVLLYCLFVKGAILDGRAGLYYAFQRMLSELLLSLYLFEGADERRPTTAENSEVRMANPETVQPRMKKRAKG